MYDYRGNKIFAIKNAILKNNIISPNVFSPLKNLEKNKQYINLQMKSISLSKDIRLLTGNDIYGRNKNIFSNKDKQYQNFIERNKFLLQRKRPQKSCSLLNIIGNYIGLHKYKMGKFINNKDKNLKNKNKINKSVNNLNVVTKLNINNIIYNINNISPKFINTKNNKESKHKINLTEINKKIIPNKNNNINDINLNINNNSPLRKFPTIINSKSSKNFINGLELIKNIEKAVKLIKEKNTKIKGRINYKLAEQNLIDWSMKSKLKFAKWKFDIPEIEKYFFDFNAFDQPEKQELIKRKTYYDYVEELIDKIQNKEEEKIKDKNYNEEEREIIENNEELNMVNNALNKYIEASKELKNVKKRRLEEDRKRYLINNILINSDLRRRLINRSTDKLFINEKKIKNKKEANINTNENTIEDKNVNENEEINFNLIKK